jgi:signal transduction histidine kinase
MNHDSTGRTGLLDSIPVIVIAPPSPDRDDLIGAAAPAEVTPFDTADDFLHEERAPGVLLLGPDLPADQTVRLLGWVADQGGEWIPLHVEQDATATGGLLIRPLSFGYPTELATVVGAASDPEGAGPLLELRWVLRFVAKARHDINNPLTAGLAETQLVLMDEPEGELLESLEVIQDQFRRIQDLVAGLTRLRVKGA